MMNMSLKTVEWKDNTVIMIDQTKLPNKLEKMIAGNIQIEDVSNFKDKSFIIDVSGSCENEEGKKDLYKIDKFLNTVHNTSS